MSPSLVAIRAVFLKDMRLVWPSTLLALFSFLLFAFVPGEMKEMRQLVGTLSTAASAFLIIAFIHLDPPASLRVDWLTRPIPPAALLAEKLLFLFVALLVPSLVSHVVFRLLAGVPFGDALGLSASEHLVSLAVALPLIAIAALTTNVIEVGVVGMVIAILAVLVPPMTLIMAGRSPEAVAGPDVWTLVLSLGAVAILGSMLALWLQYVLRRTGAARLAFAATVLLAIVLQLAFAFSLSAPS